MGILDRIIGYFSENTRLFSSVLSFSGNSPLFPASVLQFCPDTRKHRKVVFFMIFKKTRKRATFGSHRFVKTRQNRLLILTMTTFSCFVTPRKHHLLDTTKTPKTPKMDTAGHGRIKPEMTENTENSQKPGNSRNIRKSSKKWSKKCHFLTRF